MNTNNNAVCVYCGKGYHARYGGRYCSDECRIAAGSKYRKQETPPRVKKCKICGKEFLVHGTKAAMCSEKCKEQNKKNHQKNRYKMQRRTVYIPEEPNGRKFERELLKEREISRAFRKTDPKALDRTLALAKSIGVSYGEYVGMKATLSSEKFDEWKVRSEKKYKELKERAAN